VVVNDLGVGVRGEDSSSEAAYDVVAEIEAAGGIAAVSVDDVGTAEGGAAIVEVGLARFGRIDAVVCNAGILDQGVFPEVALPELSRQLTIHLGGAFNVIRAAWPHLIASGAGRVVTTTSPAGLYAGVTETAYGAAKAALLGLTRSLAALGSVSGVKANAISPGAFSRMTEAGGANEAFKRFTERYRTPADVSPVVAVLAHRLCPASGEVFSVSGGRVARVLVAETPGFVRPGHSPEELLAGWDSVVDERDYAVPKTTGDALAFGLEQLRRAGVAVPPLSLDEFSVRRS
jgi:NAD(P)-dependent dehydrogenase (short-subunit alcohol dehydrogenase family)